jgi:hypothetical protein
MLDRFYTIISLHTHSGSVIVRFIDISGINDPHGLNFLFIGIYYIC